MVSDEVRGGGWARWMPGLVVAWLALGATLAFFDRALRDLTWLYLPGVHFLAPWAAWPAFAVLGLAILSALRGSAPEVSRAWFVAAVAGAAGLTAAWLPLSKAGEPVYLAWRFEHYRPRYDAAVADATRGTLGPLPAFAWARRHGVELKVDSGPPLRVAFLEPGGLLDNWVGVVYDPTGRVATATGYGTAEPGRYTAAPDVLKAFGGDLVACRRIEGPYYRCQFT